MPISLRPYTDEDQARHHLMPVGFPSVARIVPAYFSDLLAIEHSGSSGSRVVGVLANAHSEDSGLSIHILPNDQQKGFATEACRQFLEICAGRGLERLFAWAVPGTGGYSLLQKVGAVTAGIVRHQDAGPSEEFFTISVEIKDR